MGEGGWYSSSGAIQKFKVLALRHFNSSKYIYICQLLSRKVSAAVAVKFVFQSGCLLLQLPFLSGVLHCARTLFFTRVCPQRGGRVAVAFQMNYFFLILQRGVDPL